MNNMTVSTATFSKRADVKDAIKHIVELSKHDLYNQSPELFPQYAKFSDGMGYSEKLGLVYNEVEDIITSTLGLDRAKLSEINPEYHVFSVESARELFLSVVAKAVDEVNVAVELRRAMPFAEFQNLADGDSGLFHIGSKNVIQFTENSNGRRNARIDKVYDRDITITPSNRKGTTAVDFYKVSARTEDLGVLVNKIARGQRLSMTQEVIDLVYATSNLSANSIYLNTFAQTSFQEGLERIEMLNNSEQLMAFGVRSALAPVLPTNDNLKFGLGMEIMKQGYISDLFGVPAMRLSQFAKNGQASKTGAFGVPSDHIVVLSMDSDKPVKVCTEGRTRFIRSMEGQTADDRIVYTVESKWAMKIASASHFLLVKTR